MKLLISNIINWMIKNFDLISLILVTCLTWISRFDLSKSVTVIVQDQLAPERFFPKSSYVFDYPNGSLSNALNKFSDKNLVLVYSYSHWDADSVSHRDDIEKIAEVLQYKIPIISLNCWDNNSDCYHTLKPNRFPQLYAYVSSSYFIEYKHSIEPIAIFDFVSSLLYPFLFPKSMNDLNGILKSYDGTFLICLNSESKRFSKRINIFHKIASMYKGESGNHRPKIAFIVFSESDLTFSDFRKTVNLTTNKLMFYDIFGTQKTYYGKYSATEVLKFLQNNSFKSVIQKFSPNGIKSLNIQNLLIDGFVVLYVYDESQKYLWNNVKSRFHFNSLAYRMMLCSNNRNVSVLDILHFQKEQAINQYLNYHKDKLACQIYFKSSVYTNFSINIEKYLRNLNINRSSHYSDINRDPFVANSALLEINWLCRKLLLMKDYQEDDVENLSEKIKVLLNSTDNSTSLPSCYTDFNRSISFAEMDGDKFSFFLKKWGIPTTDITQPQIIVIDWKHEIIHKMQSEISQISLNSLIHQIAMNNLTSHLKSDEYFFRDLFHQNFYSIDSVKLQQELMDPETDLVVFYYTPWCSYCSSIIHLYIMLVRYFKNYPKLHFTSLDTFNNDLPYKYQSEYIPALIMFPRGKKSDSFVFPITDKTASFSNLVKFVLEHSGDINLNLNSPTLNYNNEYNVSCNKVCLESARHSINQLLKTLKHVYKNIRKQITKTSIKIDKFCSSNDLHWFFLKVEQSRDWMDYTKKQYYIKFQGQLINTYHILLHKKRILRVKVSKLSKLNNGIIHVEGKKFSNKSVQVLAKDILNFSI